MITAKVKTAKKLLEKASDWTPEGSLIINGHAFSLEMRKNCGKMIALSSWSDGAGREFKSNHLYTRDMLTGFIVETTISEES